MWNSDNTSSNFPSSAEGGSAAAPSRGADVPQFETAEYQSPTGADECRSCRRPIAGQYYRVNGEMACASCAEEARRNVRPDAAHAFMRSVVLGCGAAIVGLIGYSLVGIITGLEIGFVSLAVGYIIGKAMMKGSRGIGGRRYQLVAIALTYAAVSVSAIPIAIYYGQQQAAVKPAEQQQPLEGEQAATTPQESQAPPMSFGRAIGFLVLLGLASPFLSLESPASGIIGLIILLVGIQIAWKIAAGEPQPTIDGPF